MVENIIKECKTKNRPTRKYEICFGLYGSRRKKQEVYYDGNRYDDSDNSQETFLFPVFIFCDNKSRRRGVKISDGCAQSIDINDPP